uniref:MAM domain-containing protein n=1 Tax=Wuchereria bancrofti TaxID=6293 RepID=A0AAF5PK85_WUCBA
MSLTRRMSLIVTLLAFTYPAYGCTPFDYDTIAQNVALRSHHAHGENTFKSQPITVSNSVEENGFIERANDLFCYNFDSSCRWHNVDNLLMNDDLNWYSGNGFLDRNRLQVSTGTYNTPDGTYAIVATDRIMPPNSKATLISDVVTCQLGLGELRFMYWISPEVRITVCLKRISQPYPNFDFCTSPIRGGSPGPAQISTDDLGNEPFQILIQADNFIFHSANLEGGFAIIDNLEYYGDLCSDTAMLLINRDFAASQVMHKSEPSQIPGMKNTLTVYKPVCEVLNCTFDDKDDQCSIDILNSLWSVARASVDRSRVENISSLFYKPAGSFIYIEGPITKTRLYTASFQSIIDFNFVFAYYKTSNNSKLRAIIKMSEEPTEKIIFVIPMQKKQTKRWYRELISLQAGFYDYAAIEIQDLNDDEYIGIAEFLLLDSQKRSICSQQRNS